VRYGPMWSDKTSWLIKQFGKVADTLAFKPDIDTRYTRKPVLRTHDGKSVPAVMVPIDQPEKIFEAVKRKRGVIKRVLIDETNFFSGGLVKVVRNLIGMGIDVYTAGLILDTDLQDFGPTRKLTRMADEVVESFARCDFMFLTGRCGRRARFNYFKAKKDTQIVVGADELYGVACEDHYQALHFKTGSQKQWWSRIKKLVGANHQKSDWSWFRRLKLPSKKRRPLKFSFDRWPRIEVVADSMRVGKTTAARALGIELKKLGLPVRVSLEDWSNNPYLEKSYLDSSEWILLSQEWFAKKKFEQIKRGEKEAIFIQDVSPEMDFAYALTNVLMGRMSKEHFKDYFKFYSSHKWENLPAPDVLVYLTISDEALVKRALESVRDLEKIDPSYFLLMRAVNRTWLADSDHMTVVNIDTDDLDFSKEGPARKALAGQVLKKLHDLGWKWDNSFTAEMKRQDWFAMVAI